MTDRPYTDPDGRLFCYALTDDQWAGSAVSKRRIGGAVGWVGLRSGRTPSDAALLSFADAVPAGGEGLVMLPFLLAERGPLWNDDLTGAYLGLRAHHTRGHLVRAAVEGVALQLGTVLDALEPLGPVSSIRATGGVFRSRPWREVVAAALDGPLVVTAAAESTALGAAGLGLYALGAAASPVAGVQRLAAPEPTGTRCPRGRPPRRRHVPGRPRRGGHPARPASGVGAPAVAHGEQHPVAQPLGNSWQLVVAVVGWALHWGPPHS